MRLKALSGLIIVLLATVTFTVGMCSLADAHSGRTDFQGGHRCNVPPCAGTYHFHVPNTYTSEQRFPVYEPDPQEWIDLERDNAEARKRWEEWKTGSETPSRVVKEPQPIRDWMTTIFQCAVLIALGIWGIWAWNTSWKEKLIERRQSSD